MMSICAHECADNEEKILLFHLSFLLSLFLQAEIIEWTKFSAQNSKEQRFGDDEKCRISIQKRRPKFFIKKSQNEMNEKNFTTTEKIFCKS